MSGCWELEGSNLKRVLWRSFYNVNGPWTSWKWKVISVPQPGECNNARLVKAFKSIGQTQRRGISY